MIPAQLQQTSFRFIRLQGKIPLDKGWQTSTNYPYWHPSVVMRQWCGGNIGIATGFGSLLVVDFDNAQVQEEALPQMPQTFSVKTGGKGLLHLYFFADDCSSWKVLAPDEATIADIQGAGKQVVAPGSLHESGRRYEIYSDKPIASISSATLREVFSKYAIAHEKKKNRTVQVTPNAHVAKATQSGLSVPTILEKLRIPTDINPTQCPFHSSVKGHCLSFTDSLWHCFHCLRGGHVGDLILEARGR